MHSMERSGGGNLVLSAAEFCFCLGGHTWQKTTGCASAGPRAYVIRAHVHMHPVRIQTFVSRDFLFFSGNNTSVGFRWGLDVRVVLARPTASPAQLERLDPIESQQLYVVYHSLLFLLRSVKLLSKSQFSLIQLPTIISFSFLPQTTSLFTLLLNTICSFFTTPFLSFFHWYIKRVICFHVVVMS